MTTATEEDYSPWGDLSAMPEVTIRIAELDDDCLGWWDQDRSEIALDRRQSRRQMRCTLAHELEHAKRGDEDTSHVSPILAVRQEIAACMRAARNLIPLGALVAALLWSQNESELAEELHVDEETVRIRLLTLTPDEHTMIESRIRLAEAGMCG